LKSLILASGFGTRLYPLCMNQAKALLPYRGKPLINHIVDKIAVDIDILVNINRKFEPDFRQWQKTVHRGITLCVEEVYADEQKLGAIGSVNHWIKQKKIMEDLLLIACDNYFEFKLTNFIRAFNGNNLLVAVYNVGDKHKATQYGVIELNKDRIVSLEEKPAKPKSPWIATACWLIPQNIFPHIDSFCRERKRDNLGEFISYLIAKDTVYAYRFNELWFDIGSIEVYNATCALSGP
jgi:glucose-1-phosphate thymidylyltransferase